MEIFNNAWVVGIGGGILSGLIVTVISRSLFSRKQDRERLQRISQANNEIIYAIRPGISESIIPNTDTIKKLSEATSRKYGLRADELHTVNEISSELVKEVMDSSFLSASSKQEFCEKLAAIYTEEQTARVNIQQEEEIQSYKSNLLTTYSAMLGLIAGLTSISYMFVGESKFIWVFLPAAVIVISIVFVLTIRKLFDKPRVINISNNQGLIRMGESFIKTEQPTGEAEQEKAESDGPNKAN